VAITTLLILVGGGCLSILEPEANVFFTAFNLADVGSMQSADMGELLPGPLPGQTTLMNPFAQPAGLGSSAIPVQAWPPQMTLKHRIG
jgi:hypothetical protein